MNLNQKLSNIKHIHLVLSGKGGVGKSTTSVQLALSLYQKGFKVGVLDIDLCGPSIPRMFGIDEKNVMQSEQGWVPVYVDGECRLTVMSIAFLLPKKDASVVWRGPKKTSMIRQFLSDVVWGELDYLIIDTPPGKMLIAHVKGTSDEHISVIEFLQGCHLDGAVLVTTPQVVAFNDVRKEINFCKTVGLPILGLIENMSGYVCPCCNETTNIFSTGGGKILADEFDIPLIGSLPIEPKIAELMEGTPNLINAYRETRSCELYKEIIEKIINKK